MRVCMHTYLHVHAHAYTHIRDSTYGGIFAFQMAKSTKLSKMLWWWRWL